MAVLIEAISVVVRVASIHDAFAGGWSAFEELIPNATLCCDNEIARVGFMVPADAESFINKLESKGLRFIVDGESVHIVVMEQNRGPMAKCTWAEFGHIDLDGNPDHRIAACRLIDSGEPQLFTPAGWEYESSLSQTYGFVPEGLSEKSLTFLRREGGVDVYLNAMTGKEVFIGRTRDSKADDACGCA